MLPGKPESTQTNVHKFKPQAKMPSAGVLSTLAPADVKLLKIVLGESAEFVWNELLDRPEAAQLLRRPLYTWDEQQGEAEGESDDSGIYGLDGVGGLVAALEREHFLFLRLNYCRRKAYPILQRHAGRRIGANAVNELLEWERAVEETRGEIVRGNMPLVLAMGKRTRITGVDISDLISEGNLALLRAVNKFDCARGYKFSTYACRAILKSFSRVATRMARYRGHFPTEFDPALEKSDHIEQRRLAAEDDSVHELKSILGDNMAHLSDVEKKVILARFALDQADDSNRKAKTLEQVGQLIGVTKERVRQIQNKALGKLRTALEDAVLAR